MKNAIHKTVLSVVLVAMFILPSCSAPTWFAQVESIAKEIAPMALGIVGIIDPALAPLTTEIGNGFNTLTSVLDGIKSQPTTTDLQAVEAVFNSLNANVTQLEQTLAIKDPQSQQSATQVIALVSQAVSEIAALVPADPLKATTRQPPRGWKAKDFRKAYAELRSKQAAQAHAQKLKRTRAWWKF
jgi:hypothetical protein